MPVALRSRGTDGEMAHHFLFMYNLDVPRSLFLDFYMGRVIDIFWVRVVAGYSFSPTSKGYGEISNVELAKAKSVPRAVEYIYM